LEPSFLQARTEPGAAADPVELAQSRGDWEVGRPDYMGRDAFDNILKKIDASVASPKTGERPILPHGPTFVSSLFLFLAFYLEVNVSTGLVDVRA